jgi:hypothetical protein
MAAPKVQIRRSSVAGKIPTTAQLDLGELAINTFDGTVYLKKNIDGTESVVEVGVASRNIDGGVPFSVYGGIQSIDGGGV